MKAHELLHVLTSRTLQMHQICKFLDVMMTTLEAVPRSFLSSELATPMLELASAPGARAVSTCEYLVQKCAGATGPEAVSLLCHLLHLMTMIGCYNQAHYPRSFRMLLDFVEQGRQESARTLNTRQCQLALGGMFDILCANPAVAASQVQQGAALPAAPCGVKAQTSLWYGNATRNYCSALAAQAML